MVTAISGNHHRLDFLIGPGKALDTDKYFVIGTDAIYNGLTTSPSNSKAQPRMQFPELIRDMVTSQHKLLRALGISTWSPSSAPRWAACRCCMGREPSRLHGQPCPLVPLARTPAWTVAVLEGRRKAIMLDPAGTGDYTNRPNRASGLFRDILSFLAARTPEIPATSSRTRSTFCPAFRQQDTRRSRPFDANDYIYQSWAYDRHDVGTTPGMNGDHCQGLARHQGQDLDHDRRAAGSLQPGSGGRGGGALHPRRPARADPVGPRPRCGQPDEGR